MNQGRGGDGQEPADATNVMPPGGSGGRPSEAGGRPTEDVRRRSRPGVPAGPPPPADSFRPAGPPPPADAYRPGQPVRPADEADDVPLDMTAPTLGGTAEVYRRGAAARAATPAPAGPDDLWTGTPAAQPGQPGRPGAAQPPGPAGTAAYPEGTAAYPEGAGSAGPYARDASHSGGYPPAADSGLLPASAGGYQPPPGTPGTPGAPGGTPAPAPAKRRRRGRVLAIVVVILLALLVVGDRVAVSIAQDQMVKQIEISVAESLEPGATPPTVKNVSIGGFPFLTQVLFGKFKDIGATIEGIPTTGPRISEVKANLKGLHVPLGDALTDNVGQVPVDDVRATVRMSYADLNAYLAQLDPKVQINPVDGGERIEISGTVDVPLLGSQEVGGVTTFEVQDNMLTLVPSEVSLRGAINFDIPIPSGELLPSIPIPIAGLPFDLNIVEASTDENGLSLTATAKDVVLPAAS